MFAVLRRFKRKSNTYYLAASVSRHDNWDHVLNDLCSQLVTDPVQRYEPEQFKEKLYLMVQLELFFRTTIWFPVSALMVLEHKTESLDGFANEITRIEQELRCGGSPFEIVYSSTV